MANWAIFYLLHAEQQKWSRRTCIIRTDAYFGLLQIAPKTVVPESRRDMKISMSLSMRSAWGAGAARCRSLTDALRTFRGDTEQAVHLENWTWA
jgi:hypothetical protein